MAARTCLLCGKTLSRIWADKGEEFCSREHRSQYRLRRGMDRLVEANAVASVMRRRETPKQIPTGDLRAPGPASPRAFLDALRRPPARISAPNLRLQDRPSLNTASRFLDASVIANPDADPRELPGGLRFPGPPARAPRISTRMPAHIMPAPPAPQRPSPGAETGRQAPGLRWQNSGRPVTAALLARAAKRSAATMPEARPAHRLTAPQLGRALRVSTAAGFRLPERAAPAPRFAPPAVHGLPTPSVRRTNAATGPRELPANILAIEIPAAPVRIPPPPGADFGRRFRWPGPFEVPLRSRNAADSARAMAVPFGPPEDSAKERK